jgi:uncharacterized protein
VKGPAILIAIGLALAGCQAATAPAAANQAAATPAPAAPVGDLPALTGRVVDDAGLLNPAEEAGISAQLAALEGRTTDQLVVVTTSSLGGRTIDQYGLALGNHWHVGRAGHDNGVLLIVAPNEHQVRIEVGYGLESILTNARAAEIIRQSILPHFRASQWRAGIGAGTEAIASTLIAHAGEPRQRRS